MGEMVMKMEIRRPKVSWIIFVDRHTEEGNRTYINEGKEAIRQNDK
jgi:hypothetical protein